MIWTLLVLLLLLALVGGAYGSFGGAGWGLYGWSPLGLLLIVVLILWLSGAVH